MINFRKLNDDGWRTSIFICVIGIVFTLTYSDINWYTIIGFCLGVFFEHIIEWLAHGWLQHYDCKVFNFFNWRHQRHHDNTTYHHALQPITILVPIVFILLSPFILFIIYSDNILFSGLSSGLIIGFLFAHIFLNLLHYDIHAKNKVFPLYFRNTNYYQRIYKEHITHHIEHQKSVKISEYRIYSISNPWLDILLDKCGLSNIIDKVYPRLINLIECIIYGH